MEVKFEDLSIEYINSLEKQQELKDVLLSVFNKDRVPFAKIPKNPKIEDLKAYIIGLYTAKIEAIDEAKKVAEVVELANTKTGKAKSKSDRIKEATKLVPVIISDSNPIQTLDDSSGIAEFKTYGNDEIGLHTRLVVFDVPWLIPHALFVSMKAATYAQYVQRGNSIVELAPTPRYNIQELPMLTPEEIENMKKIKSTMENS